MQWKTAANLKAAVEKSKPEGTVRELQAGPAHSRSETGDLAFSSVKWQKMSAPEFKLGH